MVVSSISYEMTTNVRSSISYSSSLNNTSTRSLFIFLQDLSVAVASELSDEKVEIVEDDEEISAVNVSCFVDDTEWTICDLVYSEPRVTRQEFTDTQFKNPALNVKCVAIRRAGFFLYNIILIVVSVP